MFEKYGFYWPHQADLIDLFLQKPNFKLADLVLEKICWKRKDCGFSMIQLVFKNGITSPVFKVQEDDGEDYITSKVKPGRIESVKIKVCENKLIEKF